MSLVALTSALADYRFPRVSGDEPWVKATDAIPAAFSPRERG